MQAVVQTGIGGINKFWGKVRKHSQRGRKLGFPTANLNLRKKIPQGIYISKTKLKNLWYFSLTFIGGAKTAETYILDFKKDIYNQWISVELIKKIRENKKFESTKELIAQMKKDHLTARLFYGKVSLT